MKKQYILMLAVLFFVSGANAQKIKSQAKDTGNTYRANDRLRNAGPVNGNKPDSVKKIKNKAMPPRSKSSGGR